MFSAWLLADIGSPWSSVNSSDSQACHHQWASLAVFLWRCAINKRHLEKGRQDYACALQSSTCASFAYILLAKASHMTKAGIRMGRDINFVKRRSWEDIHLGYQCSQSAIGTLITEFRIMMMSVRKTWGGKEKAHRGSCQVMVML